MKEIDLDLYFRCELLIKSNCIEHLIILEVQPSFNSTVKI